MAEIIEMPKLSDTMTTGTLIKWLKQEGDEISSGDMIAEVETDKATMEVEVFEDGRLLKQYVQEGDSVAIGSPICAIGEEGEEAPEVEVETAAPPEESDSDESDGTNEEEEPETDDAEPVAEENESVSAPAPAPSVKSTTDDGRVKASPLARKVAEEMGVDLSRVQGTGPGGRIVKADVEQASQSPQTPGAGTSGPSFTFGSIEEKTEKVSNMRATIAKALVKSKTEAPHFYLQSEVDAEALANIRQDLNSFLAELPAQDGGIKFTVNDLILKAAAMAAVQVPGINRSWQKDTIKQYGSVHLAFGVAIDDGLVTPVIRDAQNKSLREISTEARELIKKARDRKLKPDEMSGSTLTVTNLGMFGITDFYGIINPNNAAILSVGATIKQPVVNAHDQIVVGYRMKVGLSGDHRVIDGAVGAQYLDALRKLLEKPSILVV
ncbi:2-oxo acid dehydrogenase subunit E2 [Puniceicoccales bacterium CK1056]|uniref:Dihydrolipoamide acetyltransferase component of pyruvate dehydrogenase complex n=1 Tax=Oceanipulchritudo coccoides TaxID=2706888 RepID=A0A6B2M1B5_9BACT|nr:dihydrolipoamide acetyltransferase family protein [Oceanipulchritudo coccoides]NDV62708.1 2-oxo acid dehydrogenase subunit E2 [Oceanipulchritudo coccoides]